MCGCESSIDIDEYYYTKAMLEEVELDKKVIIADELEMINSKVIIEKVQYSYKEEHIFKPINYYWYCTEGVCIPITEKEFNNLGGNK